MKHLAYTIAKKTLITLNVNKKEMYQASRT